VCFAYEAGYKVYGHASRRTVGFIVQLYGRQTKLSNTSARSSRPVASDNRLRQPEGSQYPAVAQVCLSSQTKYASTILVRLQNHTTPSETQPG